MFAAFHFPALPLTCLLDNTQEPAALLSGSNREKSHITQLNKAALAYELTPGMRTTRALARCPDLKLHEANPTLEASAHHMILGFIDTLSPDYEVTRCDTFILDLSTLVIASEEEWLSSTRSKTSTLDFPLHIGLADTPDLAHLTSLSPLTSSSHTKTQASPPPPSTLPLQALSHFYIPEPAILHLWGLKTLGDLADLPRQGLSERLGPDSARLHDIITGKYHRLLQLHRPIPDYQAAHSFEPPIDSTEPILFIARRLLQTLCNRLTSHSRAAAELHLTLAFENGAAHSRELKLSEPCQNPPPLLQALQTHLDPLKIPAPLIEFHLRLIPTLPRQAQHQLFQRGLKDANQFADTLKNLHLLVGQDQIGIPLPTNTHRPDQFHLHPLKTDLSLPPSTEEAPLTQLPLCRNRPPIPIQVASEKRSRYLYPLALLTGPHQGTVVNFRGPFPLSGQWWESAWQQVQWDISLPKNLLLQLTFTPPHDWHLTGTYG